MFADLPTVSLEYAQKNLTFIEEDRDLIGDESYVLGWFYEDEAGEAFYVENPDRARDALSAQATVLRRHR